MTKTVLPDYYEILGVDKSATPEEIKKAYRAAAAAVHPDKNHATTALFRIVQEAYEVLSDPQRRREYDNAGGEEAKKAGREPEPQPPTEREPQKRRRNVIISILLFVPKLLFLSLGYLLSALTGLFGLISGILRGVFSLLTLAFVIVFVMMWIDGTKEHLLGFGITIVCLSLLTAAAEKIPLWVLNIADFLKVLGKEL